MKLHKDDQVKIVKGKDAGKDGKVVEVYTKEDKVLVEGVNMYKRHMKARSQGQQSEIITITKPLPFGNVQLICPKCKKPTRVGYKGDGNKKTRICRKCEGVIK